MTKSIDQLRRDAKALRRSYEAGNAEARALIRAIAPRDGGRALKHADYLHVVARQAGFASWPALAAAEALHGLDRAARLQQLTRAMVMGQDHVVRHLLDAEPVLADATLALAAGFYRSETVRALLSKPQAEPPSETPGFIRFCQSRMWRLYPERSGAMIEVAEAFLAAGTDVNRGIPSPDDPAHTLSPLYFALGHAGNLPLSRWLLEQGADPNDGESLYHATELGHLDGIRLLMEFGVDPAGTNALPRALDFDDADMVALLLEAGARPTEFNAAEVGGEAPITVPALHQAARRMSSERIVDLLISAGADPAQLWDGVSAYAYARVYGHAHLAERLTALGHDHPLAPPVALMADAASGHPPTGIVNPEDLPPEFRDILRNMVHLPEKLPHMQALVAIGLEYDRPDPHSALTPVQVAGWEGLPEVMGYFLTLKPDLSHVNGYGGTLLSTIIHGSENAPPRAGQDHVACLDLALTEGVALPRPAIRLAGDPEVAAFLADWAEAHPGQVVEHGIG